MHEHHGCGEVFANLSSYVDGDLSGASCEELAAHLQACEPCRRYLQSLKATKEVLRAAGEEPPLSRDAVSRSLEECLAALRQARRNGA
jgi:anti-sigma factor RsiW